MAGSKSPDPILIYLAGPMESVGPEVAKEWRDQLAEDWAEHPNILFFSPAHAFLGVSRVNFGAAHFINRLIIHNCNGLLANLENGVPFWTIREIEHARMIQLPVVISDPSGAYAETQQLDFVRETSLEDGMVALLTKIAEVKNRPPEVILGHLPIQLQPPEEEIGDD